PSSGRSARAVDGVAGPRGHGAIGRDPARPAGPEDNPPSRAPHRWTAKTGPSRPSPRSRPGRRRPACRPSTRPRAGRPGPSQLIASPNVLSAALADPKVAALKTVRESADPEGELRRKLAVVVVPRSYLIKVGMISPSATDAATAVNAVVDAYLQTAAEWASGS